MNKRKKERYLNKFNGLLRGAKVPFYLHRMGPKKFTSWKLIKLGLLKEKFGCSFRDIVEFADIVGIEEIHFTTLQKFLQRVPQELWNLLQRLSADLEEVDIAAVDSTGISRTNASKHFLWKIHRKGPDKQALKLSILADCDSHKIFCARIRSNFFGSHDIKDVMYLLRNSKVGFSAFRGDKAYDAGWLRKFLKEKSIETVIPLRKNSGKKRRRKYLCDMKKYAKGSNVESTFSALKRKYGCSVSSRNFKMQKAQLLCRIILHNLDMSKFYFILTFSTEPIEL